MNNEIQEQKQAAKREKRIDLLRSVLFNTVVLAVLAILIFTSSVTAFASDCEEIRQDVLRLHILANSNSRRDQELKLMVRDEILRLDGELFSKMQTKENAKKIMAQSLEKIKTQATAVLRENGSSDEVHAELTNMYFTTREYDGFVLPAGKYDALRVTIGEAQGKNWWCVLYPPLCIPAASREEALDVLSGDERMIIKGGEKYEFKFAVVELIEKMKNEFFVKSEEKAK